MNATDRPAYGHSGVVGGLLMACHPGPAAAVTVLVTVLAAAAGHDGLGCLLIAAAVLAGQLSVGWCNDAVDAARDRAAGRSAKPVVSGSVGAPAVWGAATVALGLAVPLSLACGPLAGSVHLVGVGAAWAYDLGVKATVLSWLPYATGFAALPAFVTLSLPGSPWPAWWVVVCGALVGVGAHLGNVLPDIGSDLAVGVRGWPQRLGPARVRLLLPVPLVVASAVLALAGPPPGTGGSGGVGSGVVGPVAVAVAVLTAVSGALLGRRRPEVPFIAAIAVAGIDVAMLVWRGAAIT
ncbi:UbiA family prenyltransferase [Streptomyces sp. CB03238]|uniref:UbiA family prenyltransferase n=1 Tax=Streptomyces sp. CB03238 TaxID=1907777 RepID=UPI001F4E79BA|nr:UbiA family prenyltransferase [Streptomyces sp. CB03238]